LGGQHYPARCPDGRRCVISTAARGERSKDQRQRRDRDDAKANQHDTDRIKGTQLEHGGLPTRLTPLVARFLAENGVIVSAAWPRRDNPQQEDVGGPDFNQ
jgi:hypothetical protein